MDKGIMLCCIVPSVIMLDVIEQRDVMLPAIMLNVFMWNVILLSVIFNVILMSVIMPNVV
jgi:hypothetical protein